MEAEILQNLGLTQAEAKSYLILLETGSTKVGKVIEKSGLQSSTVHNVLHSLIDKGFVTYIIKGKIKLYQATNPKMILGYYKEKEKQFEQLLPQLEAKQLSQQRQQAEIYEGMKGVTVMLTKFIEDTRPGDLFCFFSIDVPGMNEEIQKFFTMYDAKRKAKKLQVRGLAREELRPLYEKRKFPKVKYVRFPIPANVSICNDRMALITWGERPTGTLIQSRQLAQSQMRFFNSIWKIAKK